MNFILILALIAIMGIVGAMDMRDAEIASKIKAEARERNAVYSEACIAQYDAGRRHAEVYGCARVARVMPPHILSMPVKESR